MYSGLALLVSISNLQDQLNLAFHYLKITMRFLITGSPQKLVTVGK